VGASGIVDGDCVLLAERWDGSTWTIQTTPTPFGYESGCLNGVSCTSATACTAVGSDFNDHGDSTYDTETLAERWNGSNWTVQPSADPSGATNSSLSSVSCTAAVCSAVGSSNGATLAESWDGNTWTLQATPNPSGGGNLSGVSCTSAAACMATGYDVSGGGVVLTLAERYSA
jgi:hypothetical protein